MTLSVYFKKSFMGMIFITVFLVLVFSNGCSGCGVGCSSCSGISQKCSRCMHGYWLHDNQCKPCPINCEECSNDRNCSKCKIGFHGTSCKLNCTLCKDGVCDINEGQCINGCIDGYYEDTNVVDKKCRLCSYNCKLCKNQSHCSECDKGYYKRSLENSIGELYTICYQCPPLCEECDTSNNCTLCKHGTYGSFCQYNCSDSQCYRCNNVDDVEKCTECTTGYTLGENACAPVITCSQNCANGCDESNLCAGDCKDEWSGQTCTQKCASQCQKCQQDNNNVCTKCFGDFFASSCNTPCNEHCSEGSPGDTCRFLDGLCVNGCTDGYWGGACHRTCYAGCNSAQCNQTNGFCTTCHRSYYGSACEHTCSEHCFDDSNIHQICRTSDGKCELGCTSGYSGDRCEYPTSSTITSSSTSDNTSTEKSTCYSQLQQQASSEAKFYVLGFVSGVGFSLMVAAGFGLFCFLSFLVLLCAKIVLSYIRRRHKFTSETTNTLETKEEKAYENTTMGMRAMSSTETDYERLQGDRLDDQQQYTELGRPERN